MAFDVAIDTDYVVVKNWTACNARFNNLASRERNLLEMKRTDLSRIRKMTLALLAVAGAATLLIVSPSAAQAPASAPPPKAAAPKAAPAKAAAASRTARAKAPPATLAQLMRGTLYPASNVIFAVQDKDPTKIPPEAEPSTALNPLASTYGGWQAVENAGLAMAEVANLLMVPGRKCSNGIDVPIRNADWAKWVQGLKDAGASAYKAAQAKDQDKILEAAGNVSEACSNCHDKYREKTNLADRCK